MSFQAYLDNIKAKTGKSVEEFKNLGEKKGFLENGELKETVKAGEIVSWLKNDFQLGHGHSMAIYAVFKRKKENIIVNGETCFTDRDVIKKSANKRRK